MKVIGRKSRLAIILVLALVLLTGVVLVPLSYNRPLSYQFLNGYKPAHYYRMSSPDKGTIEETIYSFKADYDTVCAAAKSELLLIGYMDQTESAYSNQRHEYGKTTTKQIHVKIMEGDVFDAQATRDNPNSIVFGYKQGWISVVVTCIRPKLSIKTYWKYWSRRLASLF